MKCIIRNSYVEIIPIIIVFIYYIICINGKYQLKLFNSSKEIEELYLIAELVNIKASSLSNGFCECSLKHLLCRCENEFGDSVLDCDPSYALALVDIMMEEDSSKLTLNSNSFDERMLGQYSDTHELKPLAKFPIYTEESISILILLRVSQRGTEEFNLTQESRSKSWNKETIERMDDIFQCEQLNIIIHGFNSALVDVDNLRKGFETYCRRNKIFCCILLVDWSKGAILRKLSPLTSYTQAAINTVIVGREIAYFTLLLNKHNIFDPKNIHLVGFSLGAQVAHFAAQYFSSEFYDYSHPNSPQDAKKYGRITGLDPAARGFLGNNSHLTSADAEFVDVIHTTNADTGSLRDAYSSQFGIGYPIGTVDFFPNGEKPGKQPGCSGRFNFFSSCSHEKAIIYFVDSLINVDLKQFESYPCNSIDNLTLCRDDSQLDLRKENKCDSKSRSVMGIRSIYFCGTGKQFLIYTGESNQNYI